MNSQLERASYLVLVVLTAWGSPDPSSGQQTRPENVKAPPEPAVILTPAPPPEPRINGPKVYGARPGHPFIYRVPTTGLRPIEFTAESLPDTLKLDTAGGIITGTTPARGEYRVTLRAKNPHGESSRPFKIVAGDTLAFTPPMGWNHWYTHYERITDTLMREAADVMVTSGMADVGYQFVNIDDCWSNTRKHADPLRVGPLRDERGNIIPNRHFPDMKALTDYIHAKGLKAGIYTSPGPMTCAGFAAAYQHEEQDARQFADWGFDFLKYDWCTYEDIAKQLPGSDLEKFKKPYQQMGELLQRQPRDIVFNLCQYGLGDVWKWGAEVGGHSWRTAGDLGYVLDRVFDVAITNAKHGEWSKPGSWNDPDYIQIGYIGAAENKGEPQPCPLTPNEQYAFMSLWSLSAAPLFFSGHMGKLDAFTINVLCNPEVIEIDQDPLGQCGRIVPLNDNTFVMVKDLEDGGKAVGLFNRGELPQKVTAKWSDLGIQGKQTVRDLWRQKDLGAFSDQFETTVARHGTVLIRISSTGPHVWLSQPPKDCPFEPSKSLTGIAFTGRHSDYHCGDTWYPSWATDDNLYSPWTDGETDGVKSNSGGETAVTGNAIMIGNDPLRLTIKNTSSPQPAGPRPYEGRYPCGSLVYNGVWYYGTYCLGPAAAVFHEGFNYNWPVLGPMPGFRISTDFGKTWTPSPLSPDKPLFPEPKQFMGPVKMGCPHFVDFGRNMKHSPDGKAYLLGIGAEENDPKPRYANLSWITADQVYLARVTPSPETINDIGKYEFFAGHDAQSKPIWTNDFARIKPLLDWNNNMGCATITYDAPLKKYLMCVTDGWPTCAKMNSYILEADAIIGPWRLVVYLKDFGEQGYFLNFPSKFIDQDGQTLWLCYSANFAPDWNRQKLKVNPPGGRYGLCLFEVSLLKPGYKPPSD